MRKKIRMSSDFSAAVLHAGRKWSDIFRILKERISQEFCVQKNHTSQFSNSPDTNFISYN